MSPEQASGSLVDFRSDQFSFGCVLYEMATGAHAFRKEQPSETLAAILREDPEPLGSVNARIPAPLCWIVERCLAKDAEARYASTRDLARDLAAVRDRFDEAPSRPPARPSKLPAPRTGFVGRAPGKDSPGGASPPADVPLVTLTGPGGIGKTRLALDVALEKEGDFSGRITFVPLAPSRTPKASSRRLVRRWECGRPAASPRGCPSRPLAVLGRPAGAAHSRQLRAPPAGGGDRVGTGGDRTEAEASCDQPVASHVYGECEFPIPPLEYPGREAGLEDVSRSDAVALLRQRAAAVKPGSARPEKSLA